MDKTGDIKGMASAILTISTFGSASYHSEYFPDARQDARIALYRCLFIARGYCFVGWQHKLQQPIATAQGSGPRCS
jgi:hypothetical protein